MEVKGVSLEFIEEFLAKVQAHEAKTGKELTTTDVCKEIVMPATKSAASAYLPLIAGKVGAKSKKKFVDVANVFVSHAWRYRHVDVLNTMITYGREEQKKSKAKLVYFWFDLFINNQHAASNLPQEWWSTTFKRAVGEIGSTLLIMMPWNDPIPLTRAWCLWEILCTASEGAKLNIRLPGSQDEEFRAAIKRDFTQVLQALTTIRAERAEAFLPNDKDMIFKAIETTYSFPRLNQLVKDQLREWLSTVGQQATAEICQKKAPTEDDFFFLHSYSALAQDLGQWDNAEKTLKKAIEICNKIHNNDEFKNARTYTLLGNVYTAKGSYKEAKAIHLNVLRILEERNNAGLLRNVGGIGMVHNDVSICCREMRDFEESIEHSEKAIEILEGVRDGPNVASAYSNLSITYMEQGRYDEAKEKAEKAAEISVAVYGEEHPATSGIYNNLATCYAKIGNNEDAMEYHEKVLASRIGVLGEVHPEVARSKNNLGDLYSIEGEMDKAKDFWQSARSIWKETLGKDNHQVAIPITSLGTASLKEGNLDEAMQLYTEALRIRQKSRGKEHSDTAFSHVNIGSVHLAQGNNSKAVEQFEIAIKIYEKTVGAQSTSLLQPLQQIGNAYMAQDLHQQAIKAQERSVDIATRQLGASATESGSALVYLGVSYAQGQRMKDAIRTFEKALKIYEENLDDDEHEFTSSLLRNLARAYREDGQEEKAEECEERLG